MDAGAIHRTGARVESQAALSRYTTFQLGGPCRTLVHCTSAEQARQVLPALAQRDAPLVWMGGGSNLLVSDHGFDGIALRLVTPDPDIRITGREVTVDAGASLDALVHATVQAGLDGLVCCSGIPGTVGGAIVGNAGAWGRQIGDCLLDVTTITTAGTITVRPADQLAFAYRRSALQHEQSLVLQARFRLTPADPITLARQRAEILATRAAKHPDPTQLPCIGSFFRNIEPTSAAGQRQAAGWFLEQAGAKAMHVGGASVYPKHANIIVKGKNCSAQDVLTLAHQMAGAVQQQFDIRLVREARCLGPFLNEPSTTSSGFY